jgi:homocitrate synthase
MIVADRDYVLSKYNIKKLKEIEELVADLVEVNIPFNNYIHAKAILNNPSTYEIISPADFGMSRYVHFASRLTGWNAIKSRADQLGFEMTDAQYKQCTAEIKKMADVKKITLDETDAIISRFHHNLNHEEEKPLLPGLTPEEQAQLDQLDAGLEAEPEKRKLDADAAADAPVAKKTRTTAAA